MGRRAPIALSVAATLAIGCSWTTFNAYKQNDDVYALTQGSFGEKAAIMTNTEGSTSFGALAGPLGAGVRFYPLGDGTSDPSGSPSNNDAVCVVNADALATDQACVTPVELAPVGTVNPVGGGTHEGCFAVGVGRFGGISTSSVIIYCVDKNVSSLPLPPAATQLVAALASGDATTTSAIRVALAGLTPHGTSSTINTDNGSPVLLGDPLDESAFIYNSANQAAATSVRMQHPTATGESYGASVAIGRLDTAKSTTATPPETYTPAIYGVGAPNSGKIYLYIDSDPARTEASFTSPLATGCVSDGSIGFGAVFRFGDVDGNGLDDLVVTGVKDGNPVVHVYLDSHLPKTPTTSTECATTLTASDFDLSCAEVMGAGNCATSEFGHSIAIGDMNGTGKAEQVAVGAPGASAAGNAGAGVVFLYTPTTSTDVADVRYRGDAAAGAGFGASVGMGWIGEGQDTLIVGARGEGDGYVVWCSDLPGAPTTTRCRAH